MFLYNFIKGGAPEELKRIAIMAAISGCANAYLIEVINTAAGNATQGKVVSFRFLLLYLLAFAIYYLTNKIALSVANVTIEKMLLSLRLRVANKVRQADLLVVDNLGRGQLFNTLSQETNHLSQSFPVIVNAASQQVLLVFCLLYIAYLSWAAAAVVVGVSLISGYGFALYRKALDVEMREVVAREAQLLDSLGHIVDGFKEIKVNRRKSDAIYASLSEIAVRVQTVVINIGGKWIFLMMFANIYLYFLLGILCFVLPQYVAGYNEVAFKVSSAALFCVGPMAQAVMIAPMFIKANLGLEQIAKMEASLDDQLPELDPSLEPYNFEGFRKIDYQGLSFSYRDPQQRPTFTVGPVDFQVKRGEVVFLVGGNGSGKSTVLKLLTGLYRADNGLIQIDGLAIDRVILRDMRELFSVIFDDFHLFDRLYGLEDVEQEKVQQLIDRMELTEKVQFVDGRFTNLSLSTGQRKRLALIAALLEDRPIYVFDEWAADQDAHFRAVFYNEILADLKARGKTVIAVTHDDRFFQAADRVVKLDLGKVVHDQSEQQSERSGGQAQS